MVKLITNLFIIYFTCEMSKLIAQQLFSLIISLIKLVIDSTINL